METIYNLLETYNKSIIDDKRKSMSNISYEEYRKFLKDLGFCLTKDSNSKFRFGIRYYDKEFQKFSWNTTDENAKLKKKTWCDETHRFEDFVYEYQYLPKSMIINHIETSLKRKTKASIFSTKTIYSKELAKEMLAGYDDARLNIQKINQKTIGTTHRLGSNVIWFDIDNRNDKSSINEFFKLLNYLKLKVEDFYFIEQNIITGGLHCFLKIDTNINNQEFYSKLEKELREKNIQVECNFYNKILRLPLSYEYMSIKPDSNILLSKDIISKRYWNMDLTINNSIIKFNTVLKFKKLLKTNSKWIKKVRFIRDNKPIKPKKPVKLDTSFTAGNRYDNISRTLPYLKNKGLSLEECVDLIYINNIDSKDLTKWNKEYLIKNLKSFYNKIDCNTKTTHRTNSYVSNDKLVPTKTKEFLKSDDVRLYLTDELCENILLERNKHSKQKSISDKKKKEIYNSIHTILVEIIGKMYFDIITNKRFIDERLNCYNGFQISDQFLSSLLDHLDLKWNIQYFKKPLLKLLGIKEIRNFKFKRNWVNGSCKSYNIRSLFDITKMVTHLYNKIFKKVFNMDIILIIYNILLRKKYNEINITKDDMKKWRLEEVLPIPI